MHCSSEMHTNKTKRVVRYIKGIFHLRVKYSRVQYFKLYGYSNSDLAGSLDDMKSSSWYCFNISSSTLSWCSNKQKVVAQPIVQTEFVATTTTIKLAIWLRNIFPDMGLKQEQSTQTFVYNQAAISISWDSSGRHMPTRNKFECAASKASRSVEMCLWMLYYLV